jgi:hypothetical protein
MGEERTGRIADALYALALLLVSGLVWREAGRLSLAPFDPLGPKTFPLWIAGGLAGLALLMLARLASGRDLGRARQSMVFGLGDASEEAGHARKPLVALALFGLSLAYAAALGLRGLGFLLATGIYVFCAGALLGGFERRRLLPLAVLAVAVAVAADLVFRRLFALDLP